MGHASIVRHALPRLLAPAIACALSAASAASARAQTWGIVEVGVGEWNARGRDSARRVEDEARRVGLSVTAASDISADASRLLSEEARPLESVDVTQIRAAVEQLEADVALRRRESALEQAQRIRDLSEGAVATLMQHADVARRLFDACLAETWLHLQLRDGESARRSLEGCRDQFPDVRLGANDAAPEVRRLLATVDEERAARATYALSIEGPAHGCAILVSGRRAAVIPAPARLPSGEHLIEIACPEIERRRIHRVRIGGGERTVRIDPELDDALRSPPEGAALIYRSREALARRYRQDAITVARAAGVQALIVIRPEPEPSDSDPDAEWRAERIDVESGAITATVRFRVTIAAPARWIVDALRAEQDRDMGSFRATASARSGRAEASDATLEGGAAAGDLGDAEVAGAVTASLGALALAAGWSSFAARTAFVMERQDYDRTYQRYFELTAYMERAEIAGHVLGAIGSASAIVGLALWLPPEDGTPWWSWLSGVAGALAITAGVIVGALDGFTYNCSERGACTQLQVALLGALLVETGSVGLAVPVIHSVRSALGASAAVRVRASASGASLTIGGAW